MSSLAIILGMIAAPVLIGLALKRSGVSRRRSADGGDGSSADVSSYSGDSGGDCGGSDGGGGCD